MNKSYKSVWNETTGTYVAASETAKARGKKTSSGKALAMALVAGATALQAHAGALDGGTVNTGTGQIA